MTWYGNKVSLKDGPNLDAFSRLRTSHPATLFSAQCQYSAEPLQFEAGASGTGVTPAHNANSRMVALSATAGTGTSYFQSYEYVPYQPGKSQLVFVTGLLEAGVSGATVDVGLFDANNGIFLRQSGTTLSVVRRTSTSGTVANNIVSQSLWNLDTLDGNGKSGLSLDVSKVFILVIDAQFLGMGRVRVGFDIDGQIVYVHEFLNANMLAVPYIQALTLPIQMLLSTSATASTKTCYFKCASVSSEGGFADDMGYSFATPSQSVTAADGTATHLLSLRPLTAFNSITNRIKVRLDSVDLIVTSGTNSVLWQLCVGSTFSAGPTYASVDATYSSMQYSSAVGTLSTVGTILQSGYVAASATVRGTVSAKINNRYPITLDRAGAVRAMGTLSLNVMGLGGTAPTRAVFNYTEIR